MNSVLHKIFTSTILYFMILFFKSLIDDDNRIILDTIPGQQDCQNDYINASYLDVSILNNALNNCYHKKLYSVVCILITDILSTLYFSNNYYYVNCLYSFPNCINRVMTKNINILLLKVSPHNM